MTSTEHCDRRWQTPETSAGRHWVRPDIYQRSQSNAVPQMVNHVSKTDRRMLRSTVTNAEWRLRSTRIDALPLSTERTKALCTVPTKLLFQWNDVNGMQNRC